MFQINNILASVKSIDLLPISVEEWDFTYVEDEDGGFSFVDGKWRQSTARSVEAYNINLED